MLSLKNIPMVRWLCLFVVCIVAAPLLHAGPPAWWTTRGVLDATKQANDYAAVNQGQLKQIVTAALAEMDTYLPVNPQDYIHFLVRSWSQPDPTRNDYQAVNLGQVKFVAQAFYNRFKAVYYTDRYPWTESATPANDYAAANIGQVKNLFSFDFSLPGAGLDLDGNGLPDYWEIKYFGKTGVGPNTPVTWNPALTNLQAYQQGLNPKDYYNGQSPTVSYVSGDKQVGSPNSLVPAPLIISMADSSGNPLVNAPVAFTITTGGGAFVTSSISGSVAAPIVFTDYNGQARVFYQLPPRVLQATNTINACPGSGNYTTSYQFTEKSDDGTGSYGSPFAPSNVVATLNSDGSGYVTWTNNTDPTDTEPIDILYTGPDGKPAYLVKDLPAGTTSYQIPKP